MRDAVVIDTGPAGLTAALHLVHGDVKVTLVMKETGDLQLSWDTVGPPGYSDSGRITQSLARVETHIISRPGHPHSHFTPKFITESASWFKKVLDPKLLIGDPRQNVIIPISFGALRPTSLYQPSMAVDILVVGKSHVTVGLK